MTNEDVKRAFQDGIRTGIRVADTTADTLIRSGDWKTRGGHETARAIAVGLRELLDLDLGPPPVTYEARLAVACDICRAIEEHARDGGTYRKLIYDRMGFQLDAYRPLFEAGAFTISNEFVITQADAGDEELSSRLLKECWPKNGSNTIEIVGGREPWLTICEAAHRLLDLSRALKAEQDIRERVVANAGAHSQAGLLEDGVGY